MRRAFFKSMFIVLLLFAFACQKETNDKFSSIQSNSVESQLLTVNRGVFEVDNFVDLLKISDSLYKLPEEEYLNWLKQFGGVKTLYSVYLEALDAQDKLVDYYESLDSNELAKMIKNKEIKDFAKKTFELQNNSLIELFSNDTMVDVRIPDELLPYAPILSPKGEIIINGEFYNFSISKEVTPTDGGMCSDPTIDYYLKSKQINFSDDDDRTMVLASFRYISSLNTCTQEDLYDYYSACYFYYEFYRKILGKWRESKTPWRADGWCMIEYYTTNGVRYTPKMYFSESYGRSHLFYFSVFWIGDDIRKYMHTIRPYQSSANIETRKGDVFQNFTNYLKHSPRLK